VFKNTTVRPDACREGGVIMGWGKRKTKRAMIKGIDLRMDDELQADLEFAGAEERADEPELDEAEADRGHGVAPHDGADGGATFLGEDVRVRGELSGTEDVHVEGRFEGTVDMPERVFHVGPAGRVAADVHAREVIVEGELVGNVHATGRVEITATGRLIGDIHAPRVVLADGGRVTGAVDMGSADAAEPAPAEPVRQEARPAGVSAQSAVAQPGAQTKASAQDAAKARKGATKREATDAAGPKQPLFGPPTAAEAPKAQGSSSSPNAALAALLGD
jgi:cytoskeletal protein CcmA (bactofilin family)